MSFRRKLFFSIVWVGFLSLCMPTGNAYTASEPIHRSSLFREFDHDVRSIASDPVFYIMTASLLVVPSLLSHEDPEINEVWSQSATADHIFEFGNTIGNAIFQVAASGIVLAAGKIDREPDLSDFGSDLLRAQTMNGILTMALKLITNRQRPDGERWSFPSGHTSATFASAAVIYNHYGLKYGVPAFVVGLYVGMSRLQENKHYLSDVIAGALLGTYVGLKVSGEHDSYQAFNIFPTLGKVYGISASFRF